jgi:Ca2+-binding EF-hand superfamily protein
MIAIMHLLGPAAAQPATPPVLPAVPVADALTARLAGGATIERFLDALRAEFRQLDADGDGAISTDDLTLHNAYIAALTRSAIANQIMSADSDDDGVVTADELRRKLSYERRAYAMPNNIAGLSPGDGIAQDVERMMAADADKDGRITWAEAAAWARSKSAATVAAGYGQRFQALLPLAADGKSVRWIDIQSAAQPVFRSVDSDGNGTISQDELDAHRRAQQEAARKRANEQRSADRRQPTVQSRADCTMPKASDAAKVVLVSAYESEAVSTAALGSQDVATETGQIIVEPGNEPLYLVVATFRPTIWRVSGAIERLERTVLAAHSTGPGRGRPNETPLAGVTGLPAERVAFVAGSGCIGYFTETPSTAAAKAGATVRREAGKDPAVLAGRYSAGTFLVPSGEIRTVGSRHDRPTIVIRKSSGSLVVEGGGSVVIETGERDVISELYRFNPAGIVDVDPAAVIARVPVMSYEVMPQQSGLLQLLQSGALGRNRSGEFLIRQKIRFPAELHGAHAVKFLLMRGVPKPDGDPGHSTVVSEETGEPVDFKHKN